MPKPADIHDRLSRLQAQREDLTEQIRQIQLELAEVEKMAAIKRHLDELPPEDRGILIRIAAAQLGAGPGQSI